MYEMIVVIMCSCIISTVFDVTCCCQVLGCEQYFCSASFKPSCVY